MSPSAFAGPRRSPPTSTSTRSSSVPATRPPRPRSTAAPRSDRPSRLDVRRLAAIYAGGVVGALLRVGLAQAAPAGPGGWPWATFAANLVGALLLGYFFALFHDHPEESLHHPFLGTGICGTLTTFSTLQLELFGMVDGGRLGLAAAYCAATLALGYLCLRAGIAAERRRPQVAP